MIEENAIVTALSDSQATLEIERRTACGLCGQKRGCGNATWGKLLGHKTQPFCAENKIGAKIGDSVVVGIDERAMLNTALFLYVVPLIGLLLATVLADMLFANQLYVALCAVSGLLLSFAGISWLVNRKKQRSSSSNNRYQAVILRRADSQTE